MEKISADLLTLSVVYYNNMYTYTDNIYIVAKRRDDQRRFSFIFSDARARSLSSFGFFIARAVYAGPPLLATAAAASITPSTTSGCRFRRTMAEASIKRHRNFSLLPLSPFARGLVAA